MVWLDYLELITFLCFRMFLISPWVKLSRPVKFQPVWQPQRKLNLMPYQPTGTWLGFAWFEQYNSLGSVFSVLMFDPLPLKRIPGQCKSVLAAEGHGSSLLLGKRHLMWFQLIFVVISISCAVFCDPRPWNRIQAMQIWSSWWVTCIKSLWQEMKAKIIISNLVLLIRVQQKAHWDSTLTFEYIETLTKS